MLHAYAHRSVCMYCAGGHTQLSAHIHAARTYAYMCAYMGR